MHFFVSSIILYLISNPFPTYLLFAQIEGKGFKYFINVVIQLIFFCLLDLRVPFGLILVYVRELWTSSSCSGPWFSIMVGVLRDETSECFSFDSMLYKDIEEEEEDSSSSIFTMFNFPLEVLHFTSMAFFCFSSLSIWYIWSGVGILDLKNTYCWLNSPGNKFSWE